MASEVPKEKVDNKREREIKNITKEMIKELTQITKEIRKDNDRWQNRKGITKHQKNV